jgi:Xaa-Pro aminopeptidase
VRPEQARTERLAAGLAAHELDALLVGGAVDVRYLCGFTGTNGLVLVCAETDAAPRFYTDFRYATQSAEQLPDPYVREVVSIDLQEAAVAGLEGLGADGNSADPKGVGVKGSTVKGAGVRRLGFDETALTVKQHRRLRELLPDGWELAGVSGLVGTLREVKDPGEVERIRAAAALADRALSEVLEEGVVGRTEREVAVALEFAMRRLGAEAPSFPSIVAAGEHSALPHAEPRAVEIPPDTLLTIDWGAQLEGYCSDSTRTYATGKLDEEQREVYELVRRAQAAAQAALRAGPSGREIDAVARSIIEATGHGEHFGHGVGHGVGLEIHEAPRLSRTASEQPLRAGNVVTIEPGVYLPGRFGVRIEDLLVVGEDGAQALNGLPKELTEVS